MTTAYNNPFASLEATTSVLSHKLRFSVHAAFLNSCSTFCTAVIVMAVLLPSLILSAYDHSSKFISTFFELSQNVFIIALKMYVMNLPENNVPERTGTTEEVTISSMNCTSLLQIWTGRSAAQTILNL